MKGYLISVIVPIYKVEQYLEECINSVVNQTYTNLEIILVDDGSPDNCGKICDEYAKKDDRIKVIHKPNGGLSDARNAGLDFAIGDYIAFIDSDDIIHPQFVEILLNQSLINNTDISFCDYLTFSSPSPSIKPFFSIDFVQKKNIDNKIFMKNLYNSNWSPKNVIICNKIYHKRVFENIQFEKGLIYEDDYIFTDIYSQKIKIVYINLKLYYYRTNDNSISNSKYNLNKFNSLVRLWEKRLKFFKKEKQLYKQTIQQISKFYFNAVLQNYKNANYRDIFKLVSKKYILILIFKSKKIHWKSKLYFIYKLMK
ncbi:glycosyltransferase family 2 protein [Ornithobacterium rhinotracheale]